MLINDILGEFGNGVDGSLFADDQIISKERSRIKINYFKGNYNLIKSELETIDCGEIFESDNLEIVC